MNSNLWHVRLCHYLTKTKIHQPVESLEVVVFCLHLSNFVPLFFVGILSFTALKVFQTFLTFDSRILRFMVKFTVNSMIVSYPGPMGEKQPQIVTLRLLCVAISVRRFCWYAVCGFCQGCCFMTKCPLWFHLSTGHCSRRGLFRCKPKPCCNVSFRKRKKIVFQALLIQLFLNHVVVNFNMLTEAWQPDDVLLCPDT